MTVDELITQLSILSPDQRALQIMTEGCDCLGDVGEVGVAEQYAAPSVILLMRTKRSKGVMTKVEFTEAVAKRRAEILAHGGTL